MKFVEFNKTIKEKCFPVCLLEGEEAYFRERAVEAVRDTYITQPALNDVRFEGDSLKGEKLLSFRDGLYALPFLSEMRLARAYEFYPTEKEYETVLRKYVENPSPSTVLLIVNSKKGNFDLKKQAGITYIDCSRESEEVLCKWLYGMLRRAKLNPDTDAVQLMVRYCASDAARMKQEIEKLTFLLGEGGRVTRETVDEYINKDIDYKIYELTQAASRKSYAVFTEILNDLLLKGFDEVAVLSSLTSHFRTLYDVSFMNGSEEEIAKTLGIKPYAVKKNREAAKAFGKEKTEEFYLSLYNLSNGVKGGLYGKESALFTAIAKIFFS